jgi:hypothetical protein
MAIPKAPDIPMPKPDDKDYMKVWHKYLQADIDNYELKRERNTWRRAFYAVATILFAITFALAVVVAGKIMNLNF